MYRRPLRTGIYDTRRRDHDYRPARGHSDLNQLLSPTTLERAEALDVIESPTVYDGSTKVLRHKIARRTLWDLGPMAKKHLDMQAIPGFDEETATLRSDANEGGRSSIHPPPY